MFAHLRAQSWFSFLRGLASPAALVQAAAQAGLHALALTDRHSLTGAIEFYDACTAAGIQPILGLEVLATPPPASLTTAPGVLVLLAQDLAGWRSLCRLASELPNDDAVLPWESLSQETAGLLCLSGGVRGAAHQMLLAGDDSSVQALLIELKTLFPGSLYVELQQHTPADSAVVLSLARLAKRLALPCVATHDIHYLLPSQVHLQRVVSAIRLNQPLDSLPDAAAAPGEARFLTPDEMTERFSAFPVALAAPAEIAVRCPLILPLGRPRFPEIELPPGDTVLGVLRRRAEAGAHQLYTSSGESLPSAVTTRLEHELAVIGECGYAALFLIVEDILAYARRQGVPFSSRGSAASSLVAHCLGITSPDPLRLNLYFERFLNPARATPPDIDTDLCSRRREDVIRYVYRRFGEDRVATVATINRFRSRSALRAVAKAYGLPTTEVSALADALPRGWWGPPSRRAGSEDPYAELSALHRGVRHQAIFRDAAALIGAPDHLSMHPGGIVITPDPMTDSVPTAMAARGVAITQFDMDGIERLGLVKIDLLGIRGLTVLGDVAEALSPHAFLTGIPPSSSVGDESSSPSRLDFLDSIPLDDSDTRDTLFNGRTIGCFQIESPGMRATLREIRAASIDDLMVALALYRPGPLTGGLKDAFVRRHLGREPVTQLHPALTPLLADTYGVILYQEQVLRIAHELAGLSLADADLLRRAMSHFDPGKQMRTLQDKFVAGAHTRYGVPEETSNRVWELMAAFAGYGFPKAHAASYALIGWRAAWCKTHHPALFMAAVLANWGGYYGQRVYLTEARRLGLALRPPDVNHAGRQFTAQFTGQTAVLYMGLDQVKDLTARTQTNILAQRPFTSLADFLARADPRLAEAEALAKAGALEEFGVTPAVLRSLKDSGWRAGQLSLFGGETSSAEDWTLAQKVAAQEEVLGVGVAAHPLELAVFRIAESGALNTLEAAARLNQRVRVAGMRQTWRRALTITGEPIYFMALEDLEGMLEVVISAEVYHCCRRAFDTAGPYMVEGEVSYNAEKGEPFIRAHNIERV